MKLIKFTPFIKTRARFTILGCTGFIAKRKYLSRGFKIEKQNTFTQLHLGRISIAIEKRARYTHNFAGNNK